MVLSDFFPTFLFRSLSFLKHSASMPENTRCVQHLTGAVGVEASELSPEPSRNLQSMELKKEREIKMITDSVPNTMVWKLLDFCPPLFLIWSHVVSFLLPSTPGLLFQDTGVA